MTSERCCFLSIVLDEWQICRSGSWYQWLEKKVGQMLDGGRSQ